MSVIRDQRIGDLEALTEVLLDEDRAASMRRASRRRG
jgi:hypothetical protein